MRTPRVALAAFLIALVGTVVTPSRDEARAGFPVASGKILFSSDYGNTNNWDLYTINPDGSGLTNVTNTPTEFEQWPAYSADGSKIVFRRGHPLHPTEWEIWTSDGQGGNLRQLTSNAAADESPGWSPDRRRIVFTTNRDDPNPNCTDPPCNWEIYMMRASGRHQKRLTNDPAQDIFPDFSPDGTKILFSSDREGMWALYTMNVDGTNVQRLTPLARQAGDGEWSPDGSKIVFENNFCPSCPQSDIWKMNADGSRAVQVTFGSANETNPTWSPDGEWIAFQGYMGQFDIYIVKAVGTNLQNLTNDPTYWQVEPSWGPG